MKRKLSEIKECAGCGRLQAVECMTSDFSKTSFACEECVQAYMEGGDIKVFIEANKRKAMN